MGRSIFVILLLASMNVRADDLTLQQWLDLYVKSCVGGGSSSIVSGSVGADAELSLKKFAADGSLTGEVKLTRANYSLLSEGISNKMTETAANEADKVRECLAPLRQTLMEVMSRQMGVSSPGTDPVFILSPGEEKVMKVLANQRGEDGKTGKNVSTQVVMNATGMSDLRLRTTMQMLSSKLLANQSQYAEVAGVVPNASIKMVDVVSLWDKGEDYVVKMGYAK
ncbi:hypothetical protein [Paraburkholderia flagellata]|uniref:hypothetical protein n=1 Tax=Paraburkholderia flagellata TaxID=2883241 RepID=UPI001F178B95|nr:hypothetical protein [Paraburkholderia flagellata]